MFSQQVLHGAHCLLRLRGELASNSILMLSEPAAAVARHPSELRGRRDGGPERARCEAPSGSTALAGVTVPPAAAGRASTGAAVPPLPPGQSLPVPLSGMSSETRAGIKTEQSDGARLGTEPPAPQHRSGWGVCRRPDSPLGRSGAPWRCLCHRPLLLL